MTRTSSDELTLYGVTIGSVERMLMDFVWLHVRGGYDTNLNYHLKCYWPWTYIHNCKDVGLIDYFHTQDGCTAAIQLTPLGKKVFNAYQLLR